ncbi:hypothetical protein SDC9_66222 [bioreactor metagenome]|uniref:Uncharacterized protein n=1 Tax=bioreactor metagenome TaxID=1076179 RepID=A0A644XUA7_9ZZZZ
MNILSCSTLSELINAIEPCVEINLENDRYDLSDFYVQGHKYVYQIINNKDKKIDLLLRDLNNLTIKSNRETLLYLHDGSLILENCKDIKVTNINFNMFFLKYKTPIILKNCSNIFLDCSINSDSNIVLEVFNCNDIFISARNTDGLVKTYNCQRIYSDISVNGNYSGLRALTVEDEVAVTVNDHYDKIISKIQVNLDISIVYSIGEKLVIYNNKEEYINDRMPSIPVVSPEKYKCAFIAPYEWEAIGDLYIYDFKKNTSEIVIKAETMKNQNCIKKVVWHNEDELYLIIGPAYGTVSKGGNIYKFNIQNKKLETVLVCKEREEVTDLNILNEKAELKIIRFDNEFLSYEERKEYLDI